MPMAHDAIGAALATTDDSTLSTVAESCFGTSPLAVTYAEPARLVAVAAYVLTKPTRLSSPTILARFCVWRVGGREGVREEVL